MQTASLADSKRANEALAHSCSTLRTNVQSNDSGRAVVRFTAAVLRKAHDLFDGNVRKRLTGLAKVHIRTVDNWKSADRQVDLEQFFHLLEGDYGVPFMEAFWDCVPEKTRDRWFAAELLRRRLAEREAARVAEDRELDQLRMELNSR
jgi:hypothetical protein